VAYLQDSILVFFDHLESNPVIADAEPHVAAAVSFLIWP
jgi:hypothetical protein